MPKGMDTTTKPNIAGLTPRELKKKILVREAAELNTLCEAAFRKHFSHLIRKLSPRCHRVELGDAITLPPAPTKAAE